jgi:glycosyltransferase involved in cell wall biosynthesis
VVDDGSTDATPDILRRYEHADSRVRVVVQDNQGAGAARNRGLELARGAYLLFLDADDYFAPDMFEAMVADAHAHDSDVVLCRTSFLDVATGEVTPQEYTVRFLEPGIVYSSDDLSASMFEYCVGWSWDKLIRHDLVKETKLRFQTLQNTDDAYFVYMVLVYSKRISFVDRLFVTHRKNDPRSLENNRHLSWECPFIATESIEERLREDGLFEQYQYPLARWMFTFGLWHYETLSGDAKTAAFERIRATWLPRFTLLCNDERAQPFMLDFVEALRKDHAELYQLFIQQYWEREESRSTVASLSAQIEDLAQSLARTEQSLGETRDALAAMGQARDQLERRLEQTVQEYESSLSYRLGRKMTALPRALRDASSGKQEGSSSQL